MGTNVPAGQPVQAVAVLLSLSMVPAGHACEAHVPYSPAALRSVPAGHVPHGVLELPSLSTVPAAHRKAELPQGPAEPPATYCPWPQATQGVNAMESSSVLPGRHAGHVPLQPLGVYVPTVQATHGVEALPSVSEVPEGHA